MSWRRRDRSERSDDVHGIGEIVDHLLERGPLARGLPLGRLVSGWADVVGAKLAEETVPVRLDRGVLTVVASSSAWAAQVTFLASDVARRAREVLDRDDVREVRVQVGSGPVRKRQNRRSER